MVVSEGAELTFGKLDPQAIEQPSCEETLPGPTICKLSLQFASLAINLGRLVRQYKKEK
jgi:hypothetical protein